MTAALDHVVAPSTAQRPSWIGVEEWDRMSWAARMRAARRALRAAPPMTDDGAASAPAATDEVGGSWRAPSTAPAPSSPTWPCAIGCGRHTTLVYCAPCAALHEVDPASPPPRWLTAAWSNRRTVDYLARIYAGHVRHPLDGGHPNRPRRYRPVTP